MIHFIDALFPSAKHDEPYAEKGNSEGSYDNENHDGIEDNPAKPKRDEKIANQNRKIMGERSQGDIPLLNLIKQNTRKANRTEQTRKKRLQHDG